MTYIESNTDPCLPEEGYIYKRTLPDGRCVRVQQMTFNKGRLSVSPTELSLTYDDGW